MDIWNNMQKKLQLSVIDNYYYYSTKKILHAREDNTKVSLL